MRAEYPQDTGGTESWIMHVESYSGLCFTFSICVQKHCRFAEGSHIIFFFIQPETVEDPSWGLEWLRNGVNLKFKRDSKKCLLGILNTVEGSGSGYDFVKPQHQ